MAKKEAKKSEEQLVVKFTVPAFRHEGKIYKSADVEKAAENGDEAAEALVAHLVSIGSGVVKVCELKVVEGESKEPDESQEGGTDNE